MTERPPVPSEPVRRDARAVRRELAANVEQRDATLMAEFHFNRLMQRAQEALEDISPDEEQAMARWNQLLDKEAESTQAFNLLMDDMRAALQPRSSGTERRVRQINLEDPAWKEKNSAWETAIRQDLGRLGVGDGEAVKEVTLEAGRFLEAAAATMTAYAMTDEIDAFTRTRKIELADPKKRPDAINDLQWFLAQEFGCSAEEAALIVKLAVEELAPSKKPSIQEILQVAEQIWRTYGMHSLKATTAKYAIGTLVNEQLRRIISDRDKFYLRDGVFRFDLFLTFLGATIAANAANNLENHSQRQLERSIKEELNCQLVNTLMFRRWEYLPAVDDAEMMAIVDKGYRAIEMMLNRGFAKLLPAVQAAVMSGYQLTNIHPLMALTSVAGAVATVAAEKKIAEGERRRGDTDERRQRGRKKALDGLSTDTEALKVSEDAANVAARVLDSMNAPGRGERDSLKDRILSDLKHRLPSSVLALTIGAVGHVLQRDKGMKGEEVVRQIRVAANTFQTVQEVTRMIETDFHHAVRDFRRMQEVLGTEQDLDMPDGPRERARIPFGALKDHTISFENLWFRDVIRGATEQIEEGTYALLVGRSGTGKSTILRHIADILPAQYGAVRIGGVLVSDVKKYGPDSLYASMAYANQQPKTFPEKTVRENVTIWIPHLERSDEDIRAILDDLGLQKFSKDLNQPLGYTSGGETLRFGLARALIKRPKILLLDEPTGPLDPETANDVWALLEQMHEKDPTMTIICVTHSERVIGTFDKNDSGRKQVIRMGDIQPAEEADAHEAEPSKV